MSGRIEVYLPENEIEMNTLRQGDIISQIHLLGAINLNAVQYSADYLGKKLGWQVPTAPVFGDALVLSHSCEVELENKVKVTSVILAPIRDVNTATEKEKVAELIKTNLIVENETKASYLKYFFLEPNEKMEHKNGAIVDFSKCFSVRRNAYDHLLQRKILQIKPEVVLSLSLKLGLYFHRSPEIQKKVAGAIEAK
jgi:hypothetical protein